MRITITCVLLSALLLPCVAEAHHSFAEFDRQRIIEIAGTLSSVAWQNPHVRLQVQSVTDGKTATWDVECHSVGVLGRAGVDPKALKVGDRVKVAGNPSRATPNRMFATNVLTSFGELEMVPGVKPRWQATAVGFQPSAFAAAAAPARPPTKGIFKTWGSAREDPQASPYALWSGSMSLTPAAQKALAAWDPVHDTVARGCNPKGMPTIMEQPYGMQFEDRGATILLRLEEYDTIRTIHMSEGGATPAAKSLLGYSVGKWDGATLVVNTSGISWPYIAPNGLPQGTASRLEERFTPSADGKRLMYTLTINDPETFTKPPVLTRAWVWRADERVRRYACGKQQGLAQ